MYNFFIASIVALASSAAWAGCPTGTIAQGTDQNGQSICVVANTGTGSGPAPTGNGTSGSGVGGNAGGGGVPQSEAYFKEQCISNLSDLASQQLHAQLLKDKAVTSQVLAAAKISESELGGNCAKICNNYAYVSHMISWAHKSPGFLSEPEHTNQKVFGNLPQPPLPGKVDLQSCLPVYIVASWCPKSGSGVGAGPSRIENPLDKIKVCISGGDALKNMNFSDADIAHNCARPNIVDAAERIKAEHKCVADAAPAPKVILPPGPVAQRKP
jgi:hypothetical protein